MGATINQHGSIGQYMVLLAEDFTRARYFLIFNLSLVLIKNFLQVFDTSCLWRVHCSNDFKLSRVVNRTSSNLASICLSTNSPAASRIVLLHLVRKPVSQITVYPMKRMYTLVISDLSLLSFDSAQFFFFFFFY